MKYCLYAKKGVDYTKYGFVEESGHFTIWRTTRRIDIKKSDYSLSFNNITNEILKIFADMIKDNVVIIREYKDHKPRTHYINLSDEEYEIIVKMRNENSYEKGEQ